MPVMHTGCSDNVYSSVFEICLRPKSQENGKRTHTGSEREREEKVDNNSSSIRSIWLYCLSNGPKLMCCTHIDTIVIVFADVSSLLLFSVRMVVVIAIASDCCCCHKRPLVRHCRYRFGVVVAIPITIVTLLFSAYFSISSTIIAIVLC